MTREEIEATDWAKNLKIDEDKNRVAEGTYDEAVRIITNCHAVNVFGENDGYCIYYQDHFCLEILDGLQSAIDWCKLFGLPIESVDGEPYMLKRDILAELTNWLNDKPQYEEVLSKIEELKIAKSS